jgi:hypothetical protein
MGICNSPWRTLGWYSEDGVIIYLRRLELKRSSIVTNNVTNTQRASDPVSYEQHSIML